MREEKIAIINRMVEKGYHLFGKTVEQMADMMSLEDWQRAEIAFQTYKANN